MVQATTSERLTYEAFCRMCGRVTEHAFGACVTCARVPVAVPPAMAPPPACPGRPADAGRAVHRRDGTGRAA